MTSSLVLLAGWLLSATPARPAARAGRRPAGPPAPEPSARPTAADAKAFVDGVNAELKRLWIRSSTAEWIKSTYITDDTERNAAALNEDVMAYLAERDRRRGPLRRREARPRHRAHAAPAPRWRRAAGAERSGQARPSSPASPRSSRASTARASGAARQRRARPRRDCGDLQVRGGPREEPQLRRAARRVDGLAHHLRGDAPALRAPGRARQRGREGDRLRGTWATCGAAGYDMPPRRSRRRPTASGAGEAALRRAALLRARQAPEALRQGQGPRRQAHPGAPARQHVGAGVGQPLPAGRAVQGRRSAST